MARVTRILSLHNMLVQRKRLAWRPCGLCAGDVASLFGRLLQVLFSVCLAGSVWLPLQTACCLTASQVLHANSAVTTSYRNPEGCIEDRRLLEYAQGYVQAQATFVVNLSASIASCQQH